MVMPLPNDHMFWCGDFNWHHPLWETDKNRHLYNSAGMINPLLDLITEHNMQITLPPGIQTYETTTSNWTCPDNMWCKDNPENSITICDVDPSLCPPCADHLPIYIVLDLPVQKGGLLSYSKHVQCWLQNYQQKALRAHSSMLPSQGNLIKGWTRTHCWHPSRLHPRNSQGRSTSQ